MLEEKNAYILGTELEELNRLGYQHQVWSEEARKAWRQAGFSYGHDILDLGSGPGFCSLELAYLVGESGQVMAIDKSPSFISFLENITQQRSLKNVKCQCGDFLDLELEAESLDGVYHRWALAWTDHVSDILKKVRRGMKPGAHFVSHEYYDWSTFQIHPSTEALNSSIVAARKAWEEMEGDINIGRRLPSLLEENGFELVSTRILSKLANPGDMTWHWPKTFFQVYLPKLVERGYLDENVRILAMKDFEELQGSSATTLLCPSVIEIIARKA